MMNHTQVHGRRRKMLSIADAIHSMLRESVNTGKPALGTSRFQSLLLHFEADRVRLAGMLFGENGEFIENLRTGLCPDDKHEFEGGICVWCATEEKMRNEQVG